MTQLTEPQAERRVGYRDRTFWPGQLTWLIILGVLWLWTHDLTLTWPLVIYVAGVALLETASVMVGVRSRRGLTLAADGITWHKRELFIPWSNVAGGAEEFDARGGVRFVVRVAEPDHVLESVPGFGGWEFRSNLKRFGGPIALKADRLSVPAEELVADIERLRQEYAAAGGFSAFAYSPAGFRRERAARSVKVWGALFSAGLVLMLLGSLAAPRGSHAQASGGLTFVFQSTSGKAGFMDQVLNIGNPGRSAVAPTLAFVPLDGDGREVPGVTVRTAFGSDHGMVVIPPRSSGFDILAFDGPGFQKVVGVRTIVADAVRVGSPRTAVRELHVQRIGSSGGPVEPPQPFSELSLVNPNFASASVRLVCIIWSQPPPGAPQQMLEAIPIGGLIEATALGESTVPVTGPVKDRTQLCGSVAVYLSR